MKNDTYTNYLDTITFDDLRKLEAKYSTVEVEEEIYIPSTESEVSFDTLMNLADQYAEVAIEDEPYLPCLDNLLLSDVDVVLKDDIVTSDASVDVMSEVFNNTFFEIEILAA